MKILGFNISKETPVINTALPPKLSEMEFFNYRNKKYDYTKPYIETITNKWVNFGDDNLYPDIMNELANRCGLHSSILHFKSRAIMGSGYVLDGLDGLDTPKKIEALQFINHMGGDKGLEDIISELTSHFVKHNIIYLKLHWNNEHTKVIKVEPIEPSKLRLGVDKSEPENVREYWYCFDWALNGTYGIKKYPPFDPSKKSEKVQIYRYQNNQSTSKFYALPSYTSGTNWMFLSGEISNFQKSNIENSINPSMAVKFYQLPANEEEKREILNGISRTYAGSSNAGKAMVTFSDSKETAPDITPIQTSSLDKQFAVTSDQIDRNVCYAHGINPMIMGIKTPGSLGGSTEVSESFDIFDKIWIQPSQREIERVINKLFKLNGLSITMRLNDAKLIQQK